MNHGSLFSGIGGFDLAAEWMGWNNILHCEINPFAQKILKHYWPNATSHTDITKTDFTIHRGSINILTGGFPCQPYSLAGKRKGKEDERHLWPEMLRAIREIQPRWVVGENVFGLVNWSEGLVFHEVQVDLEAEGYEVFPYVLPACAVNAPHRRDRIWFVAYRNGDGGQDKPRNMERAARKTNTEREQSISTGFTTCSENGYAANPNSNGQQRSNGQHEINASEGRFDAQHDIKQNVFGNTASKRLERCFRWSSERNRFTINNWQNFPTQPPICGGNDGLPTELDGITFSKWRNESIKGYGNAIVPQVAYQIFKAIEQYELNN